MTDNIEGKNILLISDIHYGCERLLEKSLKSLGAKEVVLKTPYPLKGSFRNHIKLKTLFSFLKNPQERTRATKELIKEIDDLTFDTVLCVENTNFSLCFLDYLRRKNPDVSITMFLWDTVDKHHPRYNDYWSRFDKVYIFDRDEANKYGFEYYPDFYIGEKNEPVEPQYDIAFIGSMRRGTTMQRAFTLHKIQQFCNEHGLRQYFRLKCKEYKNPKVNFIKTAYRKVCNKKYWDTVAKYIPYSFIYKDTISLEEVDRIYSQSMVLLDLAYPGRQGMTINCITAIAKGKKLITTNKRIKEEPFYDPANIFIIDENNPKLDIEFFKSPVKPINLEYLRVDNWLKHILNREK